MGIDKGFLVDLRAKLGWQVPVRQSEEVRLWWIRGCVGGFETEGNPSVGRERLGRQSCRG